MTPAPTLFDQPSARASDPETSIAAAQQVAPKAPTARLRVLRALAEHGPMTDHEIAATIGSIQTSAGVRRCELMKAGLVEPHISPITARPMLRLTPSGATARVWALTADGREWLAAQP